MKRSSRYMACGTLWTINGLVQREIDRQNEQRKKVCAALKEVARSLRQVKD